MVNKDMPTVEMSSGRGRVGWLVGALFPFRIWGSGLLIGEPYSM